MTCSDSAVLDTPAAAPIHLERRWPKEGYTRIPNSVSYTHLTLPTNREV